MVARMVATQEPKDRHPYRLRHLRCRNVISDGNGVYRIIFRVLSYLTYKVGTYVRLLWL